MAQFNPGSKVTAGKLLKFEYGTMLSSGTSTTLANNTTTEITLDTVDIDVPGAADTANNRIVIPVSGLWLCWATLDYAGSATGRREIIIAVNGAGLIWHTNDVDDSSTVSGRITASGGLVLAAGDFVTLLGRQDSGGNLDAEVTPRGPRLGASLLAET